MMRKRADDEREPPPLPPHGRAPAVEHRCKLCGAPASWETLHNLGARCGPCYAAYCSDPLARQLKGWAPLPEKTP